MPEYIFRCSNKKCSKKKIILEKHMSETFADSQLTCKKCGSFLHRDYLAENKPLHIPEDFRMANQEDVRKFNYDKGPHVGSLLDSEHD